MISGVERSLVPACSYVGVNEGVLLPLVFHSAQTLVERGDYGRHVSSGIHSMSEGHLNHDLLCPFPPSELPAAYAKAATHK